ncbi:MAG: MaoC/PaaZ C-terminal domain-containing protein [Pseudomonadota bacterium]
MNSYTLTDIGLGLSHSFEVIVTESMMEQFKVMSGDINPLHTDKAFALEKGFVNKVVYGMLTASFYSTLVGVYLPGKYALLQGVDITFHHPVFPGDRLTVYGEVKYIHTILGQIEIKAHINNQQGKKVSKAKIKVGINV